MALNGEGGETVGEDEEEPNAGWCGGPKYRGFSASLRFGRNDSFSERCDGVRVEGAAEVGAAEVGAAIGRGAMEEDGFEIALAEALEEQVGVELRVHGIAGEGVVELEAKMVLCGDGHAGATEREARGGVPGWMEAGWSGVGHSPEV